MNFFIYLVIIILFRYLVEKIIIKTNNIHTLFRSFFCFFISSLSLCFSVLNWSNLITKPLESTYLSTIINKLMLSYMLIDTSYLVNIYLTTIDIKEIRIELIIHHIICIGLYGLFYDKSIMAFCALGEILSAFNWIGIIYPQHEWSIKLFRLYSILFIRFFIWIFTLVFLYKYFLLFWFGVFGVMIFMAFDCYWVWVILSNYLKYKSYIKHKIVSKSKQIKKISRNN